MMNVIKPRPAAQGEVLGDSATLPENMCDALDRFGVDEVIRDVLHEDFCQMFGAIKKAELAEFRREISPWEREHLLLNV